LLVSPGIENLWLLGSSFGFTKTHSGSNWLNDLSVSIETELEANQLLQNEAILGSKSVLAVWRETYLDDAEETDGICFIELSVLVDALFLNRP
jgi:hypothetical protein